MTRSAADLLADAFSTARAERPELRLQWVFASFGVGACLRRSTLSVSAQLVGELDLLIRSMEAAFKPYTAGDDIFVFHHQAMMSELWIGRVAAIFAVVDRTKKRPASGEWNVVARDVNAVRVAIEKHQIAEDQGRSVTTVRSPMRDGGESEIYSGDDPERAYTPVRRITERGSLSWSVVDIRKRENRWIERQDLSDRVLRLWLLLRQPEAD